MRGAKEQVLGFLVNSMDIGVGILPFLNPGIEFGAINQVAQLVELTHIDKLPAHQLLFAVVKAILFLPGNGVGFAKCIFFIATAYKA
jgi:hypothetical protein